VVDAATQEMLTALRQNQDELKQHPERIYDLVAEIALPKFDFETMSRLVLGQHWRSASPEQRSAFVTEFRNLLVRTYATALLEYKGQDIRYLPERPSSRPDQATVRTELIQPGSTPISIDYALVERDGVWKVYDLAIDRISLVTNYRGSFNAEIRQHGLDGLITRLAERNRSGQADG
jgi:phospholipid transport system substrate-binding protein